MKISTYLLLTGAAQAVKVQNTPKNQLAQVKEIDIAGDHFMRNPIDIMLMCDKLQHDFKLDWDEVFQCVNDAHMASTTFEGYGLTEHQKHIFKGDFDAHDANGDGLIDVYELLGFLDARGEPCYDPYDVMFGGYCMVKGGHGEEGEGEGGEHTHIEVNYVQHSSFCTTEGGAWPEMTYEGDGISLMDCVDMCSRNLWDGTQGCHGVEHHPAGGTVYTPTVLAGGNCPADFPICHTDGDCITQQAFDERAAGTFGGWEYQKNYVPGIGADPYVRCEVAEVESVVTKEGQNDSCYIATGPALSVGGYSGEHGHPAFEAYCYVPDLAGVTTTVTGDLDSLYLGCFEDAGDRDLPIYIEEGYGDPQKCFDLAHAADHQYVGLQYSGECWAGNAFGKYGKKPDEECNMACANDPSRICGSAWRNSIYETGRV